MVVENGYSSGNKSVGGLKWSRAWCSEKLKNLDDDVCKLGALLLAEVTGHGHEHPRSFFATNEWRVQLSVWHRANLSTKY